MATSGSEPPASHAITATPNSARDRKSTRLNSSHLVISYAVFCLKKKNKQRHRRPSSSECTPFHDSVDSLHRALDDSPLPTGNPAMPLRSSLHGLTPRGPRPSYSRR